MDERSAEAQLLSCCGSRAWARCMAAARPFADSTAVLDRADAVWSQLTAQDWLEAFRAHPRIGDAGALRLEPEQSGARSAGDSLLAALAEGNRLYEARFGHIFLIRAAGRDAAEMLANLHARLGNDPATELRVAAEQQREITRLRLERLLRS
jgi:OHCU decarboxylase